MKTQHNNGQFFSPKCHLSLLPRKGKPSNFTFLLAGVLALYCLISACEKKDYKPAVANTTDKGTSTTATSSSAAIVTDSDTTLVGTYTDVNSCNGEIMTINYNIPIHVHSVINDNRANFSWKAHYYYDGTGSQGNTYHGIGQELLTESAPIENGAYTGTYVVLVTMVTKGGAPNYQWRSSVKITISADGKITVFKLNDTFECKG